ncbi:MAG: UDP-N-acetylglucosamine 1-carboxyvinyltransferase [Candidatus Berkelbacteria bacterium]|nr:UDP-N-acetylglucosamine 1-carboxyvinyltransferase [Candidatus Berkelbacteria bacterium]
MMNKFIIRGGKSLRGRVEISGAKNEALKIIALSIILRGELTIKNTPIIRDVLTQLEILKSLGASFSLDEHTLQINSAAISSGDIKSPLAAQLRASIILVGPLLSRFGEVETLCPGGCLIGARSIDTHLNAFSQLGAEISTEKDKIKLSLEAPKKERVRLKERSVTVTENMILYLAGKPGKVTVENCAIEPEIIGLIEAVRKSGAKVDFESERAISIEGSADLSLSEVEIMPDRIEAATFAIALLVTGGEGEIRPFQKDFHEAFLKKLGEAGANYQVEADTLKILKTGSFRPIDVETAPYPGFPTDLQSPISLIAAKANGISNINEKMYEGRLQYLNQLEKMGVRVKIIDVHRAQIEGPCRLRSTKIESLDLRAGITLLIAALIAEGETVIQGAEIIDRGYEKVEEKLRNLGADIERETDG